ncbi:MAG: hypothetical protein ABH852_00830 [Methanobacteriota archaeon]
MKTKMAAIAVLALMMLAVLPAVRADQEDGEVGEQNREGAENQHQEGVDNQPHDGDENQYREGEENRYHEGSGDQFRGGVENAYQRGRESYANAKMNYQDSHKDWKDASDNFKEAMTRWKGDKTDKNFSQLVSASKHSADKAAEMMIRSMEMVRARIEATLGMPNNEKNQLYAEIDNYTNEIRAKQMSIQNAGDQQQIRAAAGELQRYWLQIRVRLQQMNGETIVELATVILQRVQAFAARVEARIQQLKDNDFDTSSFETMLAELRSKIDLAQQTLAQAESDLSQITDNEAFMDIFKEVQKNVRGAVSHLKEALGDLKDIIQGVRGRGHNVTIEGSGTLTAEGNGRVEITGTGTVEVRKPIDGNVRVSLNTTVTTSGNGTTNNIDNNWIQYQGYDNLVITGTDMKVVIEGNGIDIVASGTGTVRITGQGTFSTYGENNYVDDTWKDSESEVTLATGEAA